MKKLLLLFAVLLGTVGAWAQTDIIKVSTNVDFPEHVYTIKSGNNYYMYPTTGPASAKEKAAMFVFFEGDNEGDLYIFCLSNKQWVSYTANNSNDSKGFVSLIDDKATSMAWKATLVADGKDNITTCYQFQPYNTDGETYNSYMNWNGGIGSWGYSTDAEQTVGVWKDNAAADKGSAWIVEEVVLPFEISKDYENAHWFYLNIRDDGPTYLHYESDIDYIKADVQVPTAEDKYKWAIIGNVVDGFKIVNKAAGAEYVLSSPNAPTGEKNANELPRMVKETEIVEGGNAKWKISLPTHEGAIVGTFYIEYPGEGNYAINRQSYNSANTLCYWTGRDMGSALQAVNQVQAYDGAQWESFWTASAIYPEGLSVSLNHEQCECTDVYKHEEIVNVVDESVSVQITYNGGSKRIDILGVDIINSAGDVVANDYHFGFSGGSRLNNVYSMSGLAEGTYLMRFYVSNGNDGELSKTSGKFNLKKVIYSSDDEISAFFTSIKGVSNSKYNEFSTFAGTTYGCYEETSVANLNETLTALEDVASATNSGKLVDAVSAVYLIIPQPGKFYRFKHPSEDIYMLSDVYASDANRLAMGTSKVSSIFYLTADGCLLSHANGRYLPKAVKNGNWTCPVVGTAPQAVTFGRGTAKGRLGFYIGDDATRAYYSGDKTFVNAGGTIAQNVGYDWVIEDVTWLPIAMNATIGYATLYSPVELGLYDRVEAYTGAIEEDKFMMEKQDVVPANTGVVLKLTKPEEIENGYIFLPTQETSVTVSDNQLLGGIASSYINEDSYVLAYKDNVVGFYKAAKNFTVNDNGIGTKVEENGTHFLNNGFKAYLPANGSNARSLVFSFGDDTETAIESVEAENANVNTEVYDLAGRRVQSAQKGVFIVNGKVVIK